MNKQRRKTIDDLISKLEELKTEIEAVRDEEQNSFDNLHEGPQQGEQGQKMECAISALDDALNTFDDIVSNLETAKE